jgi:hypothetical protein
LKLYPTPKPEAAKGMAVRLPAGLSREANARALHTSVVPGSIYAAAVESQATASLPTIATPQTSLDYARDVMARMVPRDPVEEMLVAQMLLAHPGHAPDRPGEPADGAGADPHCQRVRGQGDASSDR